ncbi:hypothetical protein BGZ99_006465, partial [Dissophora globulifera]
PVDEDGRHPWIERGATSTLGVTDVAGSSEEASSSGSLKHQVENSEEADQDKVSKRTKAAVSKQGSTSTEGRSIAT